jgi:hypothetical protein
VKTRPNEAVRRVVQKAAVHGQFRSERISQCLLQNFTAITSDSILHASHHQSTELAKRPESRYEYGISTTQRRAQCHSHLFVQELDRRVVAPKYVPLLPAPSWLYCTDVIAHTRCIQADPFLLHICAFLFLYFLLLHQNNGFINQQQLTI